MDENLADDARLYLRHVEGGESIRAIARDAGCHASTILRRIRRFESRRDDPLVDIALQKLGAEAPPERTDRRREDQTRRVLRRLAEPGAELIVAPGMDKAIISRGDIRTAILDTRLAEQFALNGWVDLIASGNRMSRYHLSNSGRNALRRLGHGGLPRAVDFADAEPVGGPARPDGMEEAAAGFDHAAQHRVWGERVLTDPEEEKPRRMRVNLAESPLQLLARRRDGQGKAFLAPELVSAGEMLREDFELAQMGPRVTQNWDRFMTSGIDESLRGDRHIGGSDRARTRVAEALRELGPGMGDLVLRVCCFLEGLEMTERRLGWSARSGKVVLKLALERLARHYADRYGPGGPLIG
ncbi:helix-turn-helix domain-containing protein [Paracoccus aurantiacus]|uniref:Helix-turn-helix domain-containing protein n=1 Tax=Paracoccus aurantiacus TaxID=2599412 RepID=A0A5C6SA23_9RHOB|nr:helix-turn-helix domain-containing protein [Paracoccus aurantiacus]